MTNVSTSTRRTFLAALAASGAAVAVAPGVVQAQGEIPSGAGTDTGPVGGPQGFQIEAFPAPVAGTNYTFILGSDFQPNSSAYATWDKGSGEISTTAGAVFSCALNDLPAGARITEVIYAVVKSATFTGGANYYMFRMTSGSFAQLDVKGNAALPQQTAEQYVSLTVANDANWVIDNEQAAVHWLLVGLTNSRVNSVRVGWTLDRPRAFVPISPKRVFDSRFNAPVGALGLGANRVVSVANSYIVDSATVDAPNLVPAGAKAIAYNVTITNTVGSGYLSVNPGDAVALASSSINWSASGQSMANGLVVTLDTSRQVKVFCGGSTGAASDFIIDILGYYV
jgi:hypothetical protein